VQAVASGLSVVEVARTMDVSPSSVHRYRRKAAAGASLEPGRSPGGPRKIGRAEEAALRVQVATTPDATLTEHCAAWAAAGQVAVSRATMSRTLRRLDLTRKKRR
jgi:transposase